MKYLISSRFLDRQTKPLLYCDLNLHAARAGHYNMSFQKAISCLYGLYFTNMADFNMAANAAEKSYLWPSYDVCLQMEISFLSLDVTQWPL